MYFNHNNSIIFKSIPSVLVLLRINEIQIPNFLYTTSNIFFVKTITPTILLHSKILLNTWPFYSYYYHYYHYYHYYYCVIISCFYQILY